MKFLLNEGPRWLRLGSIITSLVAFVIAAFFNALASTQAGRDLGIYRNSTGDISAAYDTPITPAGWAFGIWGIIYTKQALWLCYGLASIFRKSPLGPLYMAPNIMPPSIYICFIINMIANITWLILWDRQNMVGALVDVFFMAIPLYVAQAVSCKALVEYKDTLVENGLRRDILLIRTLVQNGLAVYGTWLLVALLINLTIVMHYFGSLSLEAATYFAQSILLIVLIVYHSTTNYLVTHFTRFVIAPYLVLIFSLSGIIDKNPVAHNGNGIFSVVLLALVIGCFINKILLDCCRHVRESPESVPIMFSKFTHKPSLGAKDAKPIVDDL